MADPGPDSDRDAKDEAGSRDRAAGRRDQAADHRDRTSGVREQDGDDRDIAGLRRDRASERRDTAAAERDQISDERDLAGERRDLDGEERDKVSDQRDEAAVSRDQIGTSRDAQAQRRDAADNQRDIAANRRDRAEEILDAAAREDGSETHLRSMIARRKAAADRHHAAEERDIGARERSFAEADRALADSDRGAGTEQRSLAASDRSTASADRGAGASERTRAERDRGISFDDRSAGAIERTYSAWDRARAAQEERLAAALSDFARWLDDDFPIQNILDHLIERIVAVLSITSAGVTLHSGGMRRRYVSASTDTARRFELLQAETGEGPAVSAYETGDAVIITDLLDDARFPRFITAARKAGLARVFSFPLRNAGGQVGALNLYSDSPIEFNPQEARAAQTLADVTAAYVRIAQAREDAKAASARFQHGTLHDSLTGLPNRMLLTQRIEHAAQRAKRTHARSAVLFADLDQFKKINDARGHNIGDELLVHVAQRLSGLIRPGDTLARVSGDEFVFLCEDMESPNDAEILSERIDAAFAEPFELSVGDLTITASVGMAFSGPGEDITNQLVIDADTAMYQAKRKGGARHQMIDLRALLQSQDREILEQDLRLALARNQLDIAYQPVVRARDGAVTGVEGLLRWNHPERGPLSAASIVAIAEQTELISRIGAWVLERSCRDRSRWLAEYPGAALDLSVNVSIRQLMMPGFSTLVAATIVNTGMDPAALILEITESIFIEDDERARVVLTELRELGIRIALDDFGTGYSSLSYLRTVPIDIVKIDQTFVADICHNTTSRAIVAAITDLTQVLGFTVTVEGVETREQHAEIVTIGCRSAQGYYFARPMPASEIEKDLSGAAGGTPYLPQSDWIGTPAQPR
jgi:diguanylate cyclase (GGDEF)-like protein